MTTAAAAPQTIKSDLPCVGCKYNLRTCPRDGVCPECGMWIAESIWDVQVHQVQYGLLRAIDEAWRRQMARGLHLAFLSWIVACLGIFDSFHSYFRGPIEGIAWLAIPVTTYVIGCWSAYVLSAARRDDFKSRIARLCLWASVVAVALLYVNGAFRKFYIERDYRLFGDVGSTWPTLYFVGAIASFAWPLATIFTFGRLFQLTWLTRHRVVAAAIGLVGAVLSMYAVGLALARLQGSYQPSSHDFMPALISPVGTASAVFIGVGEYVRHPSMPSPSGLLQSVFLAAAFAALAGLVLLGPLFLLVRAWINESLALHSLPRPTRGAADTITTPPAESHAASSPPLPSPHLPS